MSFAAAAMSMGGKGLQAYGQLRMGEAAAESSEYAANIADRNAEQALMLSAEQQRRIRNIGRKEVGEMRTAYGASGVTMEGSVLDVLSESAAAYEKDALWAKYEGNVKSANFRNDAALRRFDARMSREGAFYGAAGTLLSGASDAGAKLVGVG